MYVLGHLGIGLGLAWLASTRHPRRLDYRFVLLGTILPDLIDKPLGAALGLESRLWAHTLVFLAGILAMSFVPSLAHLRWIGFGVATHLLLDLIWDQPGVGLWPLYGWAFPPGIADLGRYLDVLLHDPIIQVSEAAGFVVMVLFARAHGIWSWTSLRGFLREGRTSETSSGPQRMS